MIENLTNMPINKDFDRFCQEMLYAFHTCFQSFTIHLKLEFLSFCLSVIGGGRRGDPLTAPLLPLAVLPFRCVTRAIFEIVRFFRLNVEKNVKTV